MLDELQRRNYSQNTVYTYLHAVEDFSRYFHRSPDRLGPDHIRQYQAYLFRERKFQAGTIACCTAALRFLYVKTLRRPYLPEHIPFPKRPRQLPVVLSPEEVQRLIDSAENLMRRTMVMTLYSTGIRCSELCHLKVSDIDSERMVIHNHKGKGGRDRDVLLSPKLLETLREYWRWMKPKTYLFPGTVKGWRADVPITKKVFCNKFCEELRELFKQDRLQFHNSLQQLASPDAFSHFLRQLGQKDWVVYAKPPFGSAQHVLNYLARHTHRVAISNHRLVASRTIASPSAGET